MAKNEQCDFNAINLDSNERTPCTLDFDMPTSKLEFGIRINMPAQAKVSFDAETGRLSHDSRVPFCLAMQLPESEVADINGPVQNHVSVVMINVATGESISDNLITKRSYAKKSKPAPNPTDDPFESLTRGLYVNANLAEHLPIPAVKAKYKVYALFKTYKSNVVTIELK